jgi:hypothetical protein
MVTWARHTGVGGSERPGPLGRRSPTGLSSLGLRQGGVEAEHSDFTYGRLH